MSFSKGDNYMKKKILIVDDEAANLRALERLFRKDYDVITAGSGGAALVLLEQHDVALLISDQRMPEMTGIELLQKTVPLRPHMVRILLTGYTDVSTLIEAINCGQVYKYVTKPWNNDDLSLTVSRALEHFEANKSRHNLEMTAQRLRSRLNEISQLASDNELFLNDPDPGLSRPRRGDALGNLITSN
jgi:two-component system, sensor histidine kinase and response regulator